MENDSQDLKCEMLEIDETYYNLESAIASTAEAAHGKNGVTALVLQDHLRELCAYQYALLTGFERDV